MLKNDAAEALNFLIPDISRYMRIEWERQLAGAQLTLTPGELRALILAERAGAVRQSVLAELLSVEAMTMSVFLDKLEAHGFVRRIPDPADRRAKLVTLTDAAKPVLKKVRAINARIRSQMMTVLPPEHMELVVNGLKLMLARLVENNSEDI